MTVKCHGYKYLLLTLTSFLIVVVLAFTACDDGGGSNGGGSGGGGVDCTFGDTKCEGTTLYTCNGAGNWDLTQRYSPQCGWRPEAELYIRVSDPKLRLPPNPPSVEVGGTVTITSHSPITLTTGDLYVELHTSGGELVKTDTIPGCTIPAQGTHTIEHSMILGLELLKLIGSESVVVKARTEVGVPGVMMVPLQFQVDLPLPAFPPWS